MNYNCKYCDYVDKCSRKCEYNSVLCKMNRSFPKIVNRPYKEILYENSDLKLENTNLKKENKILKENAENNDKVVDKVNWDNRLLKQAVNEIRTLLIEHEDLEDDVLLDYALIRNSILQIVDKVLGDDNQ